MDLGVASWNLCNHKGLCESTPVRWWACIVCAIVGAENIRSLYDVRILYDNFSIMNFMSALLEPISIIAIK
jgi:hypothetical protein